MKFIFYTFGCAFGAVALVPPLTLAVRAEWGLSGVAAIALFGALIGLYAAIAENHE